MPKMPKKFQSTIGFIFENLYLCQAFIYAAPISTLDIEFATLFKSILVEKVGGANVIVLQMYFEKKVFLKFYFT